MTTTLTDPRTALVLAAANEADHLFCVACWRPGLPMMCGSPDNPAKPIHDDGSCNHPVCPLCVEARAFHRCGGPR